VKEKVVAGRRVIGGGNSLWGCKTKLLKRGVKKMLPPRHKEKLPAIGARFKNAGATIRRG